MITQMTTTGKLNPMSAARWIGGLSPFGPIFGKELRVASRRKRNHLVRIVYLGGLLLFLLAFYASMPSYAYEGNVAYRMQQQADLAQIFFATFAIFCICCMGLIAPVLTSTAINSERLGKTLPVLLMTPITSWQIASGKLFARLLVAFLLIGLSLPVLALVRLLGGVEVSQMFAVVCLCVTFAMSCGALGLFYSTLINRAYAVILMAYATIFAIYVLAPMFYSVVGIAAGGGPRTIMAMIAFNPVMNVIVLAVPEAAFGRMGSLHWVPGMIVQLSMTFVLLVASAASLRRIARREGEPAKAATTSPTPVTEPTPEVQRAIESGTSKSVSDHPVLWRELRRPLTPGWRADAAAISLTVLMLISYGVFGYAEALFERDLQIGYALVFNGLYWLLIAVLSATAIAQEKESDTWTLLLATPISGEAIVIGKFLGIVRRMLWPTLLVVIHFGVFTIVGPLSFLSYVLLLWILITFNCVWVAVGLFLSLYLRKVTTAVVLNLMIVIILFVGVPVTLLIIGELVGMGEDLAETACWYLPYYFSIASIEGLSSRLGNWYQGTVYRSVQLPNIGQVSADEFVFAVIVIGLLHVLVAVLILLLTMSFFDRIVGRSAQEARRNRKKPLNLAPQGG